MIDGINIKTLNNKPQNEYYNILQQHKERNKLKLQESEIVKEIVMERHRAQMQQPTEKDIHERQVILWLFNHAWKFDSTDKLRHELTQQLLQQSIVEGTALQVCI